MGGICGLWNSAHVIPTSRVCIGAEVVQLSKSRHFSANPLNSNNSMLSKMNKEEHFDVVVVGAGEYLRYLVPEAQY